MAETGIGISKSTKKILYELITHQETADLGLKRILTDYKKIQNKG